MKVPNEEQKAKSLELATRAFDCIAEEEYETALELSREIESYGYSAAFDIAAQAHVGLGERERAIETLERGVALIPHSWLNWQLLGNLRSDSGNYEGALKAYEGALNCTELWEDSIRMNQAILAIRMGEFELALQHLAKATDTDLRLKVTGIRVDALRHLGRLTEALDLSDQCLAGEWGEDAEEELGFLVTIRERIRLAMGVSPAEIRRESMEHVEQYGAHVSLLALIRDLDDRYSASAKYFSVAVQGSLGEGHPMADEADGFFIDYELVADNLEQALGMISEFEYLESMDFSLTIVESEVLEEQTDDPLGIYDWDERTYFVDD